MATATPTSSVASTASPVITDPGRAEALKPHPLSRWARGLVRDERDLPFVQLFTEIMLLQIPLAITCFTWELTAGALPWWMGFLYFFVCAAVFLDRYTLQLHNTSHRRLFKKEHDWMNGLVPWFFNPFFGQTAGAYFAHHMGMHHPENNLPDDLSSTMKYQRDSFLHFLHYWGTFMTIGVFQLTSYLLAKQRTKMLRNFLVGEIGFYLVVAALLFVAPAATLWVFVGPFLLIRFLMMAGNWGQHAFVAAEAPACPYRNSISCINSRYNRRAFNDGYHIGHHAKASRHWSEMPEDFVNQRHEYIDKNAIVFEGIDYFIVWLNLMLKRHDWLADRFVDLRPDGEKLSREEILALMKKRLAPIPRTE